MITSILVLIAICCSAQKAKAGKPDPTIVRIEGYLPSLPDGTTINCCKAYRHAYCYTPISDITIQNGRFCIDIDAKENNGTEEYLLHCNGNAKAIHIYASPGTVTRIKANKKDRSVWEIESKNPLQIEENKYQALWRELDAAKKDYDTRVEAIEDRYREAKASEKADITKEKWAERRKWKSIDSAFVEKAVAFMSTKEYSPVYARYLCDLTRCSSFARINKPLLAKARPLLNKVPLEEFRNEFNYIGRAKKTLCPNEDYMKVGDYMKDFAFFDHDGNEHHLYDYNDNGKFLMVEFNSRTSEACMDRRPTELLNMLHSQYGDKIDLVFVNLDTPSDWANEGKNPEKWGHDQWPEWNATKNNIDIIHNYDVMGPTYAFFTPDGRLMRSANYSGLQPTIKEILPFVKISGF